MAPTSAWRASLLDKGLKVNAGNTKVMVGSSGGKMIVNSGKWPCGVCGKGVHVTSVHCTLCKKLFTSSEVGCMMTCRGWFQTTQPTSGRAVTAVTNCCANCVESSRPQHWGSDLPFYFGASRPWGPAGWLSLLLTKAGDVETNPGPIT